MMIRLRLMGVPMGYIQDAGLLSSAIAYARDRYVYEGADRSQLAATYGYGIAKNHLFVDGNKRMTFQLDFIQMLEPLHSNRSGIPDFL